MANNNFYNNTELKDLGLKSFGSNVLISKKCSIYNAKEIEIGNNVRIDDFSILSGRIKLGSHIHIAAGCYMYGADVGIEMDDFTCISGKTSIYAISDDYSGVSMTNSVIQEKYKDLHREKVIIQKHSLIGASSVILPGVVIKEGGAFGAMSMINKSTDKWSIYAGCPVKFIKKRCTNLLELEECFIKNWTKNHGV